MISVTLKKAPKENKQTDGEKYTSNNAWVI